MDPQENPPENKYQWTTENSGWVPPFTLHSMVYVMLADSVEMDSFAIVLGQQYYSRVRAKNVIGKILASVDVIAQKTTR